MQELLARLVRGDPRPTGGTLGCEESGTDGGQFDGLASDDFVVILPLELWQGDRLVDRYEADLGV